MIRRETKSIIAKQENSFPVKNAEAETLAKYTGFEPKAVLTFFKTKPVTFQLSRFENPKDFELMNFVARICLKNADRQYKTVLHVEQTRRGSRLVASDGLRLHVAEISKKIKSGDYKPHVTKDTITLGQPLEGVYFPSWSKAVPKNVMKRGEINLEKTGLGKNRKQSEKLSVALHEFMKQTGEPVNLRFLEDLPKSEWIVYSQNEKQRAVVLRQKPVGIDVPEDKSPFAVIMPIAEAA
jgi:hypothetical protein